METSFMSPSCPRSSATNSVRICCCCCCFVAAAAPAAASVPRCSPTISLHTLQQQQQQQQHQQQSILAHFECCCFIYLHTSNFLLWPCSRFVAAVAAVAAVSAVAAAAAAGATVFLLRGVNTLQPPPIHRVLQS